MLTAASANSLSHASSDGSAPLDISSDVAVDIESVRFTGSNVGISSDPDLLSLSSDLLLTVNGGVKSTAVGCYGYISKAQTMTAVGWKTVDAVTFTGVAAGWNSGACTTGGIFTAPFDGYYYASAAVRLNEVSDTHTRIIISVNDGASAIGNGGAVIKGSMSSSYGTLQVNNVFKLSATDTVRVKVYVHADTSWILAAEGHVSVYMLGRA